MSFDDDKRRREQEHAHSLEGILNPNKLIEIRQRADQQRRKDLHELKQQVERAKVLHANSADTEEKQGTGGLKKDEVVTADTTPEVEHVILEEKHKDRVDRTTGRTEQNRNSP